MTRPISLLILILLACPAVTYASPHRQKALSLQQQLRAKDAVIADLRQQIHYLTGEVEHLRAISGNQPGSHEQSAPDELADKVKTFNRLMHRAQDDLVTFGVAEKATGDGDRKLLDDAYQQIDLAVALRKEIVSAPRYASNYVEGDVCLSTPYMDDKWRAEGADAFRYVVPAH